MLPQIESRRRLIFASWLLLAALLPVARSSEPPPTSAKREASRTRTFLFTYSATVTGLPAGKVARIWLPVPPSNEDQEVSIVSRSLPAKEQLAREAKYGNQVLYVEAQANAHGTIPVSVTYRVSRREVKVDLE